MKYGTQQKLCPLGLVGFRSKLPCWTNIWFVSTSSAIQDSQFELSAGLPQDWFNQLLSLKSKALSQLVALIKNVPRYAQARPGQPRSFET